MGKLARRHALSGRCRGELALVSWQCRRLSLPAEPGFSRSVQVDTPGVVRRRGSRRCCCVERRVRLGEEERWVLQREPEPPQAEATPGPPQEAPTWDRNYLDESRDRRLGGLIGESERSSEGNVLIRARNRLAVMGLNAWGRAVEGAQGLMNLGAYGLYKASQSATMLRGIAEHYANEAAQKLVNNPPDWLSVSYGGSPTARLRSYTVDELVSYQPLAKDFVSSITYQRVAIRGDRNFKSTVNPRGRLDIETSKWRFTFKGRERPDGSRTDFFIQPGSLSFGTIAISPDEDEAVPPNWDRSYTASTTTIDIDLFGPNWASFKVANATSRKYSRAVNIDGVEWQLSMTDQVEIDMSVHRYPRIVVGVLGAVIVFKAGVALAPALAPLLPSLGKVVPGPAVP